MAVCFLFLKSQSMLFFSLSLFSSIFIIDGIDSFNYTLQRNKSLGWRRGGRETGRTRGEERELEDGRRGRWKREREGDERAGKRGKRDGMGGKGKKRGGRRMWRRKREKQGEERKVVKSKRRRK